MSTVVSKLLATCAAEFLLFAVDQNRTMRVHSLEGGSAAKIGTWFGRTGLSVYRCVASCVIGLSAWAHVDLLDICGCDFVARLPACVREKAVLI